MSDSQPDLQEEVLRLRALLSEQKKRFVAEIENRTAVLQRARSNAEASSAAKSDFLATMSHEIRTPIHAILGTLDLLSETKLESEQGGYVSTARGSAESLLHIVNDILDFSRIEAGKLAIEPTAVEVRPMVEEVVCSLAPLAQEKNVEVVSDIFPEVPRRVMVDPSRLRQVLTNLYGNAVKFTRRGQILIRARKVEDESGQPMLRIDVRDTGIGIAPDRQRALFEPFTQADNSTSRKFGGTGLGLAISLRLTRLMGGKLGLASVPGRGSQFSVSIPLVLPPMPEAFPVPAPLKGKVLVVDHNRSAREAIGRALEYYGVLTDTAADAGSAMAALSAAGEQGAPFEAVLVDDRLPESGELALLRRIRDTAALRILPVGLLGGRTAMAEDTERLGVNVVLSKPVRQDMLAQAVRTLVGRPIGGDTVRIAVEEEAVPNGRVLLVDDNSANRKIAAAMISKAGITPEVAEDGEQALRAVRSAVERGEPFDLVLMDVQMPVMNGLEATAAIRELDSDVSNVPIVAMTANTLPEDREMCLAAGMDDYLPKPVRSQRMRGMLRRWLKEAAQTQLDTVDPKVTILRSPKPGSDSGVDFQGGILGLMSRFLDNLDARVADFVELYKESDFRALAGGAHGIREEAHAVGAARLAALAGLLEAACHDGDYESADRYARRLPRVARETASAIRATLRRLD